MNTNHGRPTRRRRRLWWGRPLAAEINIKSPVEKMLICHKQLKVADICLLNKIRKPWSSDNNMVMSFLVWDAPNAEINNPPLRPIEDVHIIHKRFNIAGVCLLTRRGNWYLDKMATSVLVWDAPSGSNRHSAITAINMLVNLKRLEIEGARLLNTNRKPYSSDKMATSFSVLRAHYSGINRRSAITAH